MAMQLSKLICDWPIIRQVEILYVQLYSSMAITHNSSASCTAVGMFCRAGGRVGQGGDPPPPDFVTSFNPIPTTGPIMPTILLLSSPHCVLKGGF